MQLKTTLHIFGEHYILLFFLVEKQPSVKATNKIAVEHKHTQCVTKGARQKSEIR